MTTKHSPHHILKAQADKIAATMKAAERGDRIDSNLTEKIKAARLKDDFKVGIIMDDKIVTITMPWTIIHTTTEAELSEYVLGQMREAREAMQ